jgi:putative DNA primase/helicase
MATNVIPPKQEWDARQLAEAGNVTSAQARVWIKKHGEATNEYFSAQDLFGQWLDDECDVEPGNTYKTEASADLFASWRAYAERAGEQPGTQKSFAENMQTRGLERFRTKSFRGFRGIRLRQQPSHFSDG